MNNKHLWRGLFLSAMALLFGLGSVQYRLGQLSQAGPGLFPLVVSGALLLIGLLMLVRARLEAPTPLHFNARAMGLVLLALCGFALLGRYVNVLCAILFLVLCTAFAASSRPWGRNLRLAGGLVLAALLLNKGLGLNLALL